MAMNRLKPALQSSEGRSKPWSGARLVNLFAEMSQGDQTDTFAIMVIPGLSAFADISTAPVRAVHRMGTVLYALIDVTLYSVSASGVPTTLGTVAGSGPAKMVDNGTQLAIAPGLNNTVGYIWDGATLTAGPLNLPAVTDVAYIDGYFVWTAYNSDQFIISSLNDGLTYDPLDVATVEGDPDNNVGVVNDHRELQFYGSATAEVWTNTGDADFPFARSGNAFIERGCADRDSIVKADSSVIFVDDRKSVCRLDGYNPVRISTHAIEYKLAQAAWFRAFNYTQEGHDFYVLNTDVGCFSYDFATGTWAERSSYGLANYRVGCAIKVYGQTVMGDAYTGKLYTPSLDVLTENGEPIVAVVELPSIERNRDRLTLYALELYAETGVGNAAVADPVAIMQYSRDGGRLWSNEMSRSLGAVGEYSTRAVWRPNVQFRSLQVRFTLPSPARKLVMGYFADVR